MQIDVLNPSELSAADLARWSALQAVNRVWDSPFLSPGWARAVEHRQPRGGQIKVCVVREAGQAVGFMAVRVAGAVAMPAGAPMNDYQGLVAEPGLVISPRQIVDALKVQRLDFSQMLEDQAAFAPFARGACISYGLDVEGGYEAYAEGRKAAGSGVIKDIDKRRRKVEREVGPVRFTALETAPLMLHQLLAWKRAQYRATGQTDVFGATWTSGLLTDLLEQRDEAFGGALFTLHIGDRLSAVQFNLLGRRTVHAWIIAHEAEFEKYSPGLMLFQDILKWMDGTPYDLLDLGAGDYRFKQQLSNRHLSVSHGFVGRPSPALLLRTAQYGVREAAEKLPLGSVSHLPAKAMRRLDLWRGLR